MKEGGSVEGMGAEVDTSSLENELEMLRAELKQEERLAGTDPEAYT